jgi:hypothetical protein
MPPNSPGSFYSAASNYAKNNPRDMLQHIGFPCYFLVFPSNCPPTIIASQPGIAVKHFREQQELI